MTSTQATNPRAPTTAVSSPTPVNVGMIERWLSAVGGVLLILYGLGHRSLKGLVMALGGSYFVYRGTTGHCAVYEATQINSVTLREQAEVKLLATVTVNKPVAEVYSFWRNLENLPYFMKHLYAVTVIDDKRSHWEVRAPTGLMLKWDAEIIGEHKNQLLAWRSLPGSNVTNTGIVQFKAAPAGRGTEVKVDIRYKLPGGMIGSVFAPFLNKVAKEQVKDELRHFKQIMETGEAVTVEGQPMGPGKEKEPDGEGNGRTQQRSPEEFAKKRFGKRKDRDLVDETNLESFPASDAPTWW